MNPMEFSKQVAKLVNRGSMRRYCKSRLWGRPGKGYGGVATADRISRYGGTAIAERRWASATPFSPSHGTEAHWFP